MPSATLARDQVEPHTRLLLKHAAEIAFPDGSMGASSLRREHTRGRLVIYRICGRDYTTLADIEQMVMLCRSDPKVLDCTSAPQRAKSEARGSSATEAKRSA